MVSIHSFTRNFGTLLEITSLIKDTLDYFKIPRKLSAVIMSYISTFAIQVLINGRKIEAFRPTRGIRQGDPMSPYLFILCMERLSRFIQDSVDHKCWVSIRISRSGPKLSHLFFADDLTLFAKADSNNCQIISSILNRFSVLTEQKVNLAKSQVILSKNCPTYTKEQCSLALNIQAKNTFGKFLGFSIFHKKPINNEFQYIIKIMWNRMTGWKFNMLNMAGKLVLAKATLDSIPLHVMNYIKIPKGVSKAMDKVTRDFFWGSSEEKKKMHLFKWDVVTQSRDLGGLGIHKTSLRNKAILSGLTWRFIQSPNTLWSSVLKSKYGNPSSLYTNHKVVSRTWKNVQDGWKDISSTSRWVIHKGHTINFLSDQ